MSYHQIVQVWGILLPVGTCSTTLLTRATVSLPYLVLLQGKLNNCVAAMLYPVIHTSLMNLFSSSASSNSSSTTVGFMFPGQGHGWAVYRWKVKGTRNTTDATRFNRFSRLPRMSECPTLLGAQFYIMLVTSGHTSRHARCASRMIPTWQSTFRGRTEGPLGL